MKYLRSLLFHFNFGLILGLAHVVLVVTWNVLGYGPFMKVVALYNLLLHKNLKIIGTQLEFELDHKLPLDRPIIIIANHQSTFDIPALIWYFRAHHVKFVAKHELEKGFPCISYTLSRNGSVFADRRDPDGAVKEISRLGRHIQENNYAAVIFPEGRRSKRLIKFRQNGLEALLKSAPDAIIQPVALHNLWKVELQWPMEIGAKCSWVCLPPIENRAETGELIDLVHQRIAEDLEKAS